MIFKEKLAQEHPELASKTILDVGCPYEFGYEYKHTCPAASPAEFRDPIKCHRCWERVMPGTEETPHILDSGERRQFDKGGCEDGRMARRHWL